MQETISQLESQRNRKMRVPHDIDGPRNIKEWYSEENEATALQYHCDAKKTPRDPEHVTLTKDFYECVLRNKREHELGPSREHLETINATIDIANKMQEELGKMGLTLARVTDYFYMTPEGETRFASSTPSDTGDPMLGQVLQMILAAIYGLRTSFENFKTDVNERFNSMERSNNEKFEQLLREQSMLIQRFNSMERSNNEKFEQLLREQSMLIQRFNSMERSNNEKFEQLWRQLNSSIARYKNQFKGAGGDAGNSLAYSPIANDEYKFPNEQGLEPLTSVAQIEDMNGAAVSEYLRFYGVYTGGNVSERKFRLLKYLGVGYRPVIMEQI